jgi:hypothetical protein
MKMAKKPDATVHFEVSFYDPVVEGRRVGLAHSESQAAELVKGFETENLEDVQVHKVLITREPHVVG